MEVVGSISSSSVLLRGILQQCAIKVDTRYRSVFTCGEVNEGPRGLWRSSDAHCLPDAIDTADVTRGHLTRQLGQVPSHLLRCRHRRSPKENVTETFAPV